LEEYWGMSGRKRRFCDISVFPVVFVPGSENDRINAGASENAFPGGRVLPFLIRFPCSFCARNQD